MRLDLTAAKGLLFRITNVANLGWLLRHGLHAASSRVLDPDFVSIGNPGLIDKRAHRVVPRPPGGVLSDYIPFYLTPKTPMLLNITTGYGGMTKRPNSDIAILVSSCQQMSARDVTMLYTDRHAYTLTAAWTADPDDLTTLIDWEILQQNDFKRSDIYPDKMDRYQAEALAFRYVPPLALLGIGCVSTAVVSSIEQTVQESGVTARLVVRPGWYF